MRKYKSYKCPVCSKIYSNLNGWTSHIEKLHPDDIPSGYSPARYFYFLQTKKTHGNCIVCSKKTEWNEETHKYQRFCNDPKCKEKYREVFKKRMMNKYGKVHLLDDPNVQSQMLKNRKISGMYTFQDGGKIDYVGSYEKDFLSMLDNFMNFSSNDIMGPSPHTYYYDYKNPQDKENEGRKFYIPDFYIPSINLEIEIKDSTNTHHKIQRVDRVKEIIKDKVMENNPKINYIKILDKNYAPFFEVLLNLKEEIKKGKSTNRASVANESLSEYLDVFNPDDVIEPVLEEFNMEINNPYVDFLNIYYNEKNNITTESVGNKYPIYIVLMHSGTMLANVIQKVTKHQYSHACISFNKELDPLYSFGRKDMSMLKTGMVINNPKHPFFTKFKTKYGVYRMMLDKTGIDKMKDRLDYFERNLSRFKYDVGGLAYNFFGAEREKVDKYFCSRFVADILNAGIGLDKNPSLYKPNEFSSLENIVLVAEGDDFYKFDPTKLK